MRIAQVHISVKPECVEPFKTACTENARHSIQEAGIVRFDVLQSEEDPTAFAWHALWSAWSGNRTAFDALHAPYCVLHRSPFRHYSGRDDVFSYYETLRGILGPASISIDHVATQPFSTNGIDIAVRWTAAGTHEGEVMGVAPTGKPMYLLGVTHWRCIAGRITAEITVFDDLAVLSQVLEP